MTETKSFEQRIARVERLVEQIEQSPDASLREAARAMVRDLLDLHAAALATMLRLFSDRGDSGARLRACLDDDLVRSMLLLHDLHPDTLETRVRQALDAARPYLQSHGGDVELVEVAGGTVRLRMQGSCQGCPSSSATLKHTIEEAIITAAPDVAEIEVEGLPEQAPSELVQLDILPQAGASTV